MSDKTDIGFGDRPIQTSDEGLAAERRIAELAVAPAGSGEEAERVGLIDAVNAYRLNQTSPATAGMTNPISSLEQYEQATRRVAELANYAEGTPQSEELHRLIEDIRAWDSRHEDVTRR